jgi:hypothetical protein
MLEYALEYLQRGWSIAPVLPGEKHPRISWKPLQEQPPTEAQVREWWARWPDANIALITGRTSGVVVVDIDTRSGGTLEGQAPSACMVKAPGGWHLFYTHPQSERIANSAKDGIDVRGDGGIIILPPSKHHSGKRYKWTLEGAPSPLPEWVLTRRHEPNTPNTPNTQKTWLTDLLTNGAPPGERNDSLAKLAGYYAGKRVPLDVARATLTQWNRAVLSEPLPEDEFTTTLESVYRTEAGNPKSKSYVNGAATKPFDVVPYGVYMRKHSQSVSWLVDDWIPDQTIAMMVAPPESYKTWLELDLAVAVASGRPFLDGVIPNRIGPVLIIQQEDFPGQTVERLATIQAVREGIAPPQYDPATKAFEAEFLSSLPIYFHEDAKLKFDDPEVMAEFHAIVAKIRPVLVIIDPLYSAASAENFMAGAVEQMMLLKTMRVDFKTTFLLAHHTHKRAGNLERERLWGSQLLNGFMETGLQMFKVPDEPSVVIKRHTKVDGPKDSVLVQHTIDTDYNFKYAPKVTPVTLEEIQAIFAAADPKTAEKQKSGAPELDPVAKKVRAALTKGPGTIAQLTERTGLTPMDLMSGLETLERQHYISRRGEVYAQVIDTL